MKNIVTFLALSVLFTTGAYAMDSEPVVVPETADIAIEYVENENSLINVDAMKNADKIKDAELKAEEGKGELKKSRAFKVDSEAITRQKALNYTTKRTNTTLPVLR